MKRANESLSRLEPALGGTLRESISGHEPALSREYGPLYGRFHVQGLEAPIVEGRRRPVVIVGEADFDTGNLVRLVADSNGYDVSVSDDGSVIWSLIQSKQPNLIVVNIRLNRFSGLEIIRQIRASNNKPKNHTPILVMDVQRQKQVVRESFDAGADDYLVMPYDLPVLLRCWQRVCGAHRQPSPITALQNEDAMVQQLALSHLLEHRPDGLCESLSEFLSVADPSLQITLRWALRRLGAIA